MSKLKQYFDSQGIRQVDICNILGKSKAQISNYLTGKGLSILTSIGVYKPICVYKTALYK